MTRGPGVLVTAQHKVTGLTQQFMVTVTSKMDVFISEIESLYSAALDYSNNDREQAFELSLNYITTQKYNDALWEGIIGARDDV